MVVGTPGGATIITSVFQTMLDVVEFGMNMQQAVDAKRFHHQWLPDNVEVERGAFDETMKAKLAQKGYKIVDVGEIGRVDAILVTADGYEGGADPRGDDTKMGW
jgi:gamma-glutamyltranspeptidase/glutathione hydrolase